MPDSQAPRRNSLSSLARRIQANNTFPSLLLHGDLMAFAACGSRGCAFDQHANALTKHKGGHASMSATFLYQCNRICFEATQHHMGESTKFPCLLVLGLHIHVAEGSRFTRYCARCALCDVSCMVCDV